MVSATRSRCSSGPSRLAQRTSRSLGSTLCSLGSGMDEAGERARAELAAGPAVERPDLPVPAGMRDLEQRLADVLGLAGLLVAMIDGVVEDDGEQQVDAPVEAGLDLLGVERIDDGARDRQGQQGPCHRGGKQPERERVSCHRPPATAGSRDRGWS